LKLWNEPCAKKCQEKVEGDIGLLEEAENHGFDIDCLDMTRKVTPMTKIRHPSYFCTLYDLPEPHCKECPFARYAVELVAELDRIE
jgi:hypothetical protein